MPDSRQFCTFYLQGKCYGIDVLHIQEVVLSQPLTCVPLADPMIRGLMNLRGQIVTAIDVRRRLGLPERDSESEPINVVMQTSDGAVALQVDEIGDVIDVDDRQFETPPPMLSAADRELIEGAYKLADQLLVVLNPDQLLKKRLDVAITT